MNRPAARLEIRAERAVWRNTIDILVTVDDGQSETVSLAQPLTFTELGRGVAIDRPTMELRPDEAQLLMDELWRCGLRPTEGAGSAGSLAATQAHLKDMRKIAFQTLKEPDA